MTTTTGVSTRDRSRGPSLRAVLTRAVGSWWLPVALLAVVLGADAVLPHLPDRLLPTGIVDECGHQATSALVLLAVPRWWSRRLRPSVVLTVLLTSSLIDVDHVPLYLGLIDPTGRPLTHSVFTPLVLGLVAVVATRRWRPYLLAAAAGVCLHLLRDLAAVPGVPLWGPFGPGDVVLGYGFYDTVLLVATLVALGNVALTRRHLRR